MNEPISVHLYGEGSRKSHLEAEYIYCDHAEECSVYAEGKCFCTRTLFGMKCPFGKVKWIDGGMKQSKKYRDTWDNAKANENYGKVKYPVYDYVTRIGVDNCFLTIPHRYPNLCSFCFKWQ